MLTEPVLAEILARVGLQAPVRFDEVTGSTNATAAALASDGTPEWTLVAAGHQRAGRGRLDRTWVDRPGDALMFSLVLRPPLAPERAGLVSLLAGVAMAEAAGRLGDPDVACKWPNDLVIGERKVGGILAESAIERGELRHLVLGIGVNLGEPPEGVPKAGALGGVRDRELLEGFLRAFRAGYRPADEGFARTVLADYREASATLGCRVRATTVEGRAVEGVAVDVDERGGLVLETTSGPASVTFGDVEHLHPGV